MGIGGGIITRKLLFAVLLISSLSLSGIAGVSAVDDGTTQTQTDYNSTVEKKANIEIDNVYNVNKSAKTQNSADKEVKTVNNKCTSTASIKTNQTKQNINFTSSECSNSQNSASTETNTQNAVSNADSNNQNSVNTSPNTVNDANSTQKQEAAAGEVKTASADQTVTSTSFTVDQIKDAAARVKSYIETNHRLPNYVTIGTTQVQMPDFLKLLTAGLLQVNSGATTPITLKNVNTPTEPTESIKSGSITKASYLDLAKRVNSFIDANGVLPNYATSTLGKLNYNSMIYMFSKILNFQKTNNRLPSYVTVAPWSTISQSTASTVVPAELQKYLSATANCQVTNAQIKALAAKITSGKTTTYAKAV
ncbi:MAG: pseudomurein-binding repeat-containing protein, partial [Methanobacterium sp.]|nr:pseudomurein-binding repeat-containing protein [Methanobacterium sp.]